MKYQLYDIGTDELVTLSSQEYIERLEKNIEEALRHLWIARNTPEQERPPHWKSKIGWGPATRIEDA